METNGQAVTDSELCREALRQVLASHAFARSEQSRNFLRYVCEKTISGHGADIKEYSIGVEALGRAPEYSPADDSSVRRRAYEIRQRLEEYYQSEKPDACVRIDLPKGSYVPVFTACDPHAAGNIPAPFAPVKTGLWPLSLRRGLVVLAVGILLGGSLTFILRKRFPAANSGVDPIIREFWGPLLSHESRALICLGNALHMVVRAGQFPEDPTLPFYPVPTELYSMYSQTHPLPPGGRLFMRPADNVASIGIISGVAVATNTLRLAGAGYQILPERTAPLASFRGRNVVLFGDALTSLAAAHELSRGFLTIGYDDSGTRLVIRDRRQPATSPPAFSRRIESASGTLEAYGLITVLPTEGSASGNERTFVISGVSNAGIHGAVEFLASPERLRNLKARFLQQGLSGPPPAYQVVVKCTAASTLLLSYEYVTHVVLDSHEAAGPK